MPSYNQSAYGLTQSLVNVFPAPVVAKRAPTANDLNYDIGTTWVDVPLNNYYVLTSIVSNVANWALLAASGGDVTDLSGDTGTATPSAGVIGINGGGSTNIVTAASGHSVSVAVISSPHFAGTTTVATGLIATTGNITATTGNIVATAGSVSAATTVTAGTTITAGTGITATTGNIVATTGNINAIAGSMTAGTTITAGTGLTVSTFGVGVVQSSSAGVFSSSTGTNGQVLIGGGIAPVWGTITPGTNITITNAANSITINANAGASTLNYTQTAVTPYVVAASDDFIAIDSSGGAKQVNLPNAPATGRIFVIKDYTGSAAAHNITVTTVGGIIDIDGATTFVMSTNYQSVQVLFDGTNYEIY